MNVTLWRPESNVPAGKHVYFKFLVDAGNAPTLVAGPSNMFVKSVVRVSQGIYRLTLHPGLFHIDTQATLNVNAAFAGRTQSGPVANAGTSTDMTVDILIVTDAGVVDPPAANANVFVSGHVTVCDIAAV